MNTKITILFFSLTLQFSYVKGQVLKTYSGTFENGSATYQYYENENYERIFHGKFTYKSDHPNGVYGYARDYILTGNYKNNLRDGAWKATTIRNEKSEIATATYIDGNLDGICSYTKTDITSNKTIAKSTATFKKNMLIGNYSYSCSSFTINLYLNAEGFADSTFTVKYGFIEDIQKYRDGFLYWQLKRDLTDGKILKKVDQTELINDWFELYDDENNYSIIPYAEFNKDSDHSHNHFPRLSNDHYKYAFEYGIEKNDSTWSFSNVPFTYIKSNQLGDYDSYSIYLEDYDTHLDLNEAISFWQNGDNGNGIHPLYFFDKGANIVDFHPVKKLAIQEDACKSYLSGKSFPKSEKKQKEADSLKAIQDSLLAIQKRIEDSLRVAQERENTYTQSLSDANNYFDLKEYELAIEYFNKALAIHENPEAENKIAKAEIFLKEEKNYLTTAEKLLAGNDFENAIANYKKGIEVRNTTDNANKLHEAEQKFSAYKTLQEFLKERNATVYNYNDFDYAHVKNIEKDIQDKAKEKLVAETKDFSSSITFQYSIDTTNKASSNFTITQTNNSLLANEIGLIGQAHALHPIYKNDYTLNASAEFTMNFSKETQKFKAEKKMNGTINISGSPSLMQQNEITNLIDRTGVYKTKVSLVKINDEEYYASKITTYRSVNGPANAIYSMLLPGVGDVFVDENDAIVRRNWYIMSGIYLGAIAVSAISYNSYINFQPMDSVYVPNGVFSHYEPDYTARDTYLTYSLVGAGIAAAIWLYDVIYVTHKGCKNKKEAKEYKKQIGISYNPTVHSLGLSCSITY